MANTLTSAEKTSVFYHDIFDYPLNFADLIRWSAGGKYQISNTKFQISSKNGFYFMEGREGLVLKRTLRKRISERKLKIAEKASKIISLIPSVKLVAITGSLAMQNANEESDIDLMIITKKGTLWISRLICLTLLINQIRRSGNKGQKDRLCMNIWLDESDLTWRKRNIYIAHEVAQVVLLYNKDKTYEKFLYKNKWILDYWPNVIRINNVKFKIYNSKPSLLEKLAYKIQYLYMKSKITHELVTPTRALFHPQDWGGIVLRRLKC